MKVTSLYIFATIAVMFVCLFDGAQSDSEVSNLDLDENGFCKTARTWSRDCNQCWCPQGGAPACTLVGCEIIKIPQYVLMKKEEMTIQATPLDSNVDSNQEIVIKKEEHKGCIIAEKL